MTETDARTARLTWVKDDDPRWDPDRERVFATVPDGVFRAEARTPGERLSSDWWRVEDGGRVVGYGWLDDVWGDAEILLAVQPSSRGQGVGSWILEHLEREAWSRGLRYLYNEIREGHPDREGLRRWLQERRFVGPTDGGLLRAVVRAPARMRASA